jgi:predicted dehydrogenase
MIKIGVIGYGYWGPNLVRNFNHNSESRVEIVSDVKSSRLDLLKKDLPSVKTTFDYNDILNDTAIDAVVIATPVFLHYTIAKRALLNGKHVMVEKPITTSSKEAMELIEIAERMKKILMVDHTFMYTGAVQKIKSIINDGEIGKVNYFDSTRINLGLFQPDINVLWDLAPHDVSILDFITKDKPIALSATGISHTHNQLENIAYMTIFYESDFIAHFTSSWTSPVKIRKILIGGTKKMILYDDVEPTEKVKIYDTGYHMRSDEDKHKMLIDYRVGDIYIPKIEQREALQAVINDFIQAIQTGKPPLADGKSGFNVVKILEAAAQSIKQKGKEIKL